MTADRVDHAGHFLIADIRRDLEEDRRLAAHLRHRTEQIIKRAMSLQIAQARRVGRGDIDGEELSQVLQALETGDIVSRAVLAIEIGAEIDADNPAAPLPPAQPGFKRVQP